MIEKLLLIMMVVLYSYLKWYLKFKKYKNSHLSILDINSFFAFITDCCMLKYYKQVFYYNRGLMMANFEIIYSNELNNVNTRYFRYSY